MNNTRFIHAFQKALNCKRAMHKLHIFKLASISTSLSEKKTLVLELTNQQPLATEIG